MLYAVKQILFGMSQKIVGAYYRGWVEGTLEVWMPYTRHPAVAI